MNFRINLLAIIAIAATLAPKANAGEIAQISPKVVVYSGEMFVGDADKMRKYLKANPSTGTVYLKSRGGMLVVGVNLGKLFAEYPALVVAVGEGDKCISACAFAFLGGNRQSLKGTLAFHRAWTEDRKLGVDAVFSEGQMAGSFMLFYLMDMGYNSQLAYIIMDKTSKHKFLVFYKKEDLDHFFVSMEKSTPIGDYLKPVGYSSHWLDRAIKPGSKM